MPTYEYHCEACKHDFEKFHSMSAPPVKVCPKCGKRKVVRKIGVGAGIIFKGGGFYETDYRNESYKKAAEADKSPSTTTTDKPAETKAESKPAESKPAETPKAEPKPKTSRSKSKKK
ncbi:MAG: zinc ribbon domain-containing protein [Tepidisphaeraceae bacterium]